MIVTDNLQRATAAANATAFMPDGGLVEHGPPTGVFTSPEKEPTSRDVTERFG